MGKQRHSSNRANDPSSAVSPFKEPQLILVATSLYQTGISVALCVTKLCGLSLPFGDQRKCNSESGKMVSLVPGLLKVPIHSYMKNQEDDWLRKAQGFQDYRIRAPLQAVLLFLLTSHPQDSCPVAASGNSVGMPRKLFTCCCHTSQGNPLHLGQSLLLESSSWY